MRTLEHQGNIGVTMSKKWNKRQKELFDVASELFAQKGYHNVAVKEIVAVLGISQAQFYYYYESKEAMLSAIFDFYEENRNKSLPTLESIMRHVGTEHPHATLSRTIAIYPVRTLPTMAKALRIANSLSTVDERAGAIMESVLTVAGNFARPILRKMIDMDLIEAIDVDHFTLLLDCYCFSAAVRHYEDKRIETPDYVAGMQLLFQLVRVKEKP